MGTHSLILSLSLFTLLLLGLLSLSGLPVSPFELLLFHRHWVWDPHSSGHSSVPWNFFLFIIVSPQFSLFCVLGALTFSPSPFYVILMTDWPIHLVLYTMHFKTTNIFYSVTFFVTYKFEKSTDFSPRKSFRWNSCHINISSTLSFLDCDNVSNSYISEPKWSVHRIFHPCRLWGWSIVTQTFRPLQLHWLWPLWALQVHPFSQ